MFKFIKNLAKTATNVSTENSAFNELKSLQDKEKKISVKEDEYYSLLKENEATFRTIMAKPGSINKKKLEECTKIFITLIELKPTKPLPYVYLSYIFYMMNNEELTIKYLNIATFLDSKNENKVFISELKALMNKK